MAVVIGAGGMGSAVARRLGQNHKVLLVDINPKRLQHQAETLREDGLQVITQVCDVTCRHSVQQLGHCVNQLGGFKALAHVAGLSPSMADWRTIMSVNLIGPALVTKELLPQVTPGSSAVLISSLSAHLGRLPAGLELLFENPLAANFLAALESTAELPMTPELSYMWSKIGVLELAQRQALAWGQRGGRVVSVSPGLIASPQGANEFKQVNGKYSLLQTCPLKRQGNLQEIAAVVAFLLSDEAAYISGTDIRVDGGNLAGVRSVNAGHVAG
nr:SDR family oxidoreductase [Aestuariicella hydrocarbonica]